MDPGQILDLITDFGIIGLLVFIIFAGMKKWWVFGWQYRECKRELDDWRTIALRALNVSESVTGRKSYDN